MFPDEASARAWVASRLAVSRETMGRLDGFAASLARWNRAINLVAPHDLPRLWARHIADSAQLFKDAPSKARHMKVIFNASRGRSLRCGRNMP